MNAITLHRTDPAKNMRWFYRLDVQPELFGQWRFIREWGRIGRAAPEGRLRQLWESALRRPCGLAPFIDRHFKTSSCGSI